MTRTRETWVWARPAWQRRPWKLIGKHGILVNRTSRMLEYRFTYRCHRSRSGPMRKR